MIFLCSVCSSFQWAVTTIHCRATFWFPLTVATPCSMRNLTFICRVNGMAPIVWIHGLPKIAVYGENKSTTINVAITSCGRHGKDSRHDCILTPRHCMNDLNYPQGRWDEVPSLLGPQPKPPLPQFQHKLLQVPHFHQLSQMILQHLTLLSRMPFVSVVSTI